MRKLFFRNGRGAGFTLIELLVVIAIIGVLASIVLASLNNARRKSRDARRITDIKQLQLALELYFDGTGAGQYPASNNTCDTTDSNGLQALVTAGTIPQIPRDPSNPATCYEYAAMTVNSNRTVYHLAATLEDSANSALNGDKDCDSSDNNPVCAPNASGNATEGFIGTDPIYDVTP